ncbi:MAG: ABC transporter permease [Deltaproteobacteria bacterium]|nr:ABC transporter permease [Deltaproteobacteria bacterium]
MSEPLTLCSRCGVAAPLRRRHYRQVTGLVLLRAVHHHEGDLCESCSRRVFLRSSLITLFFGWWSVVSVHLPAYFLVRNVLAWLGTGGAPAKTTSVARKEERPFSTEVSLDFAALPPVEDGSSLAAEWWIALSHLRSRRSGDFISLTTGLSIVGVITGVAVLNWVLAVMTGFEDDLRDKILGTNAHVVMLRQGGNVPADEEILHRFEDLPGIEAAAPFLYTEMMIRSAWGTAGIILKGMDPDHTGRVTAIRDNLSLGPAGELSTDAERDALFQSMKEPIPPLAGVDDKAYPGIILGVELQEQLHVLPGEKVQVINPLGDGTGLMGVPTPSVRTFRVAGVFDSGMYEYDTKWTYVLNQEAQSFLRVGNTWTGVEARVVDEDAVEQVAAAINAAFGPPYYTRHWKELNQPLFEALEMEKWVMGLILSTIVGVAALAIVTTLVMLVLTKGREIAILKAMGASNRGILRIFVIEGALIGLVGSVMGTALGLVGCEVISRYEYPLETDVYYLSSLPVVVDWQTVVVVAVSAMGISFVATLYPAWKAAALRPVEGLRYE